MLPRQNAFPAGRVGSRIDRAHVQTLILFLVLACAGLIPTGATAAPSADVARRCLKYSYLAYPYKRPGAARMSGDRQAYFKDCMSREGKVPEPSAAKS